MSHHRRESFRVLLLVVVAAIVSAGGGRAHAQGTSGTFPGPVDSRQLAAYGTWLDLTDEQRVALESAHDKYLREFRLLRDGEMAAFLQTQAGLQGGIPDRTKVEAYFKEQEQLLARIALIDDRLLDRIAPILTLRQQQLVPRLRMARERARSAPMLTASMYGRALVDLSEIVREIDLTPEQAETVDMVMSGYERKLTGVLRKQSTAVSRTTLDLLDALAERGYAELSQEKLLENPELLQELMGVMQEVYAVIQEDLAKGPVAIRELNHKTLRKIETFLPEDRYRQVRNMACRRGYAQLGAVVGQAEGDWMRRALELDDLSDAERAALATASATYQRRLDDVLGDGVAAIDAFWDSFSPFNVSGEQGEKLGSDLGALGEQAGKAAATAEGEVVASLGAERVEAIREEAVRVETVRSAAAEDEAAAEQIPELLEQYAFSRDRFLPRRIGVRDIERYMTQLQVDRDLGSVVRTIHIAYLEQLAENPIFAELAAARAQAGAVNEETGDEPPSAKDIEMRFDRVYALRRQAIDAMAAAETVFFDDLQSIVGEERRPLLDRVRRSRNRLAYNGSESNRFTLGLDRSQEAGIDVVSVVLSQQPDAAEFALLEAVLANYEEQAASAFRDRMEAQLAMQRIQDRWMITFGSMSRDDISDVIALQLEYRDEMTAPTMRVDKADHAVAKLNRAAIEAVTAVLPPDRAIDVRQAYDETAFPSIYEDPSALGDRLSKALTLGDLTAEQRRVVAELATTYRADYERLTREMIDSLSPSSITLASIDTEAGRAWQTRQQQLAKVQFDRNELNGRAISRLEATLTEDQVRRIGGLPDLPEEEDMFFLR